MRRFNLSRDRRESIFRQLFATICATLKIFRSFSKKNQSFGSVIFFPFFSFLFFEKNRFLRRLDLSKIKHRLKDSIIPR